MVVELWSCGCGLWSCVNGCDCEMWLVELWQRSSGCEAVVLWLPSYTNGAVIVEMWQWSCGCEAVVLELWL